MLERVAASIFRYSMFPPGARAGVAVSGGADSVCLLYALRELAPRWNLRLTVLHFNHRLRGRESDEDERFVRELGASLGLPFEAGSADVDGVRREEGGNLEQTARRLRRAFLLGFIAAGRLDRIALGHTRSDQAETVLFRVLRGSGLRGLASILPVTREGIVRPLLEVDRPAVEAWLRERGIGWREDASNRDPAFARNRIRHGLLPQLAAEWNPEVSRALSNLADLAQEEERFWSGYLDALGPGIFETREGHVIFRAADLAALPRAVGRRLVRRAIESMQGDTPQIGLEHIDEILSLAAQPGGHGRRRIPGVEAWRSLEWVRMKRPHAADQEGYSLPLSVPCDLSLPGGLRIRLELIENKSELNTSGNCATVGQVDWCRVSSNLVLRNWRPGDKYRPVGQSREKKLKQLFQEARIPLWERHYWPIITTEGRIVWARRWGAAAEFAAAGGAGPVLLVRDASDESNRGSATS